MTTRRRTPADESVKTSATHRAARPEDGPAYWAKLARGILEEIRAWGPDMIPNAEETIARYEKKGQRAALERWCRDCLEPVRAVFDPPYADVRSDVLREHLRSVDGPRRERRLRSIIETGRIRTESDHALAMEYVDSALQSGITPDNSDIAAVNAALLAFEQRVTAKAAKSRARNATNGRTP